MLLCGFTMKSKGLYLLPQPLVSINCTSMDKHSRYSFLFINLDDLFLQDLLKSLCMSAILCSSKAKSVQALPLLPPARKKNVEEDNAASAAESFSVFLNRTSKNTSPILIYSCSKCVLESGPVNIHSLSQQCICKKKEFSASVHVWKAVLEKWETEM